MSRIKEDKIREDRITMEIVVDAYSEEERAMGWYYYLEDKLRFPFMAKCIATRETSPLVIAEEVEVTKMAPEAECEHEMLVMINWQNRSLAVPLDQLKPFNTNNQTLQAIADWHYWVKRGYEF
ncbi:MAG: calcium-binding protein [Nitrospirota bacterium]|nr:calcium-binding protein [Nitrospirota bacterium]